MDYFGSYKDISHWSWWDKTKQKKPLTSKIIALHLCYLGNIMRLSAFVIFKSLSCNLKLLHLIITSWVSNDSLVDNIKRFRLEKKTQNIREKSMKDVNDKDERKQKSCFSSWWWWKQLPVVGFSVVRITDEIIWFDYYYYYFVQFICSHSNP